MPIYFERGYERTLRSSLPHAAVAAALNEDLHGTGIDYSRPEMLVASSKLFNALTAGVNVLRQEPQAHLIERPIERPARVPASASRLGRFALKIFNASLTRPNPHFRTLSLTSGSMERIGAGAETEGLFAEAVGCFGDQDDEPPSRLFVARRGEPVMLQKSINAPAALSFKALSLNRVHYPAGTLYALEPSSEAKSQRIGSLDVLLADDANIAAIAPLRLTSFAFAPPERPNIFGFPEKLDSDYREAIDKLGLKDILARLPGRVALYDIAKALSA